MISAHTSIVKFMRDFDIADEDLQFEPSLKDCYSAYRKLNTDIFKGKLPKIKLRIGRLHGSWGTCTSDIKKNICEIQLNNRFKNKQFFVTVLAHEMVHAYQHFYESDINHGYSFHKWRPTFAKFCIPLSDGYKKSSLNWHAQRNFTQITRS